MEKRTCRHCNKVIGEDPRVLGVREDGSFNWYHIPCAKKNGLIKDRNHGLTGKGLERMKKRIKGSKIQYTEDEIENIEHILSLRPEERLKRAVSLIVPMSSPLFHKEDLLNHEY